MKVEVVAVHPTTVIVLAEGRQFELPLDAFPTPPIPHQVWTLSLEHEASDEERLERLNQYLRRD